MAPLERLPLDPELRAERRELQRLAAQLAALAYQGATICQFFARFEDSSFVDRAVLPDFPRQTSPVDRLARIGELFSADASTVWRSLSEFRSEFELPPLPYPDLPLPAAELPAG